MSVILTILGIGLLLAIHEGGHYFAARSVGIRVKVFALGFGPRLFGWKRNGTDFRLALLPLGGYVQVAGDDPSQPPKPGDLFYASASQRLFFYSGGIIANFLFAFLLVPILFQFGVPFVSPTLGQVQNSSPAWEAGLSTDDKILEINGRKIHGFRHINSAIALSSQGSTLPVKLERNGVIENISLKPEYDSNQGFSTIGISPAYNIQLAETSLVKKELGDYSELIAINGISLDNFLGSTLALRSLISGKDFSILSKNEFGETKLFNFNAKDYLNTNVGPTLLGVQVMQQEVENCKGFLANKLIAGDLIKAVNNNLISGLDDILIEASKQSEASQLLIVRNGEELTLDIPAMPAHEWQRNLSLKANTDLSYWVHPLSAAADAGLKSGVQILRANNQPVTSIADLQEIMLNREEGSALEIVTLSSKDNETNTVSITPKPTPQLELGLMLAPHKTKVVATSFGESIQLGYREAYSMVRDVVTTAKRLISGEVAAKNMGGIISIGVLTNTLAEEGLMSLLFFLCLISVNLGVLNLLPIPALDGGHIVFALYEIITRRKVSIAVQNAFQLVGVALVLTMIVYVTKNDIQRFFP